MNINRLTRGLLQGILLLASGATLSALPILTIDSHNLPYDSGGQFTARLDNGAPFHVYCVDFNNFAFVNQSFEVNVSTVNDLSATRYGTTATSAFSYQTAPNGSSIGSALNRYLMAAWLITQYDLNPNAVGSDRNVGIQDAIWNLLDATGQQHMHGDWATWMNSAVANLPAAQSLASQIRIYTTASVGATAGSTRYSLGNQEMIGFVTADSPVPEPRSAALLLIGGAMIGAGVWRKRRLNSMR